MTIPDYQSLMLPVMRLVESSGRTRVRDMLDELCEQFGLSEDEREQMLESGQQTVISNRTHWAATYMVKAGLLDRPERGVLALTERGREILRSNPERIDTAMLRRFDEFRDFQARRNTGAEAQGASDAPDYPAAGTEETPEARIDSAVEEIRSELRGEILERIRAAEPIFFEHLIIRLMRAMGYGAAGDSRHVGKSHDGGIDGVISEDPLGLEIVCLQAKRYAEGNSIGVEQIRAFAGSLDEQGATKGVFVTTSHFARPALDYARAIPKRLILIDGDRLSRLCVEYGVGVRTHLSIELKRIDENFFAPIE